MYIKVKFDEILFIKSAGNYLEVHTSEKMHLIRKSMKDFAKSLPESHFFRVHKSYVINLENVDQLGPNFLVIAQTEIPVAANVRSTLMRRLGIG